MMISNVVREMGYMTVKEEQMKVIKAFVSGKDVFVSLPTGFGKSLCFHCLPKLFDRIRQVRTSLVVVVSPLSSLMKDQTKQLSDRGVTAIDVGRDDGQEKKDIVLSGIYQILFTSPETLLDQDWRDVFQNRLFIDRLVGIIIDEAHCVKTW